MMEYTLFGESHGPAVGVLLTNVPAGLPVDGPFIREQLLRRMGRDGLTTARREADEVQLLSGVYQGKTTGDPLAAVIWNKDVRSADYEALAHTPRPSHGDYAAAVRAHGCNDPRGGGHTSGRLTAPLTAAGALALTCLAERGIAVRAEIVDEDGLRARAAEARREGDSVGGMLETAILGLPAGIGEPYFDSVESEIAHLAFSIPAVKGIEFGTGFGFAGLRGSEANDAFRMTAEGAVVTATNHNAGINGGIANGMPVVFRTAVKPTPSIYKQQDTVDYIAKKDAQLSIQGRHDPCIVPRAAIVQTCAAALAVGDLLTARYGARWMTDPTGYRKED